MKPDLETRIADAFGADLNSKQLSALLAEVAQADQEAKTASERANETALDPATRPDAVAKARKEMEDADFKRLRMERATAKLGEMRDTALERETNDELAAEYAAAVVERDQLAKDLEEYDELSRKIVHLLERLVRSDKRLEAASKHGSWIQPAEVVVRGGNFESWFPRLALGVRLPIFRRGDGGNMGYLWPKP